MFKVEQDQARVRTVLTIYGYIGGYIDYRDIAGVLDQIRNSPYKDIDIHLHTYGGSVFDGNMIINFLENHTGKVSIYVDGIAASMGALITLPAHEVYIAENGFMMLHAPSGSTAGTAKDHLSSAKLLRSIEITACKRLAKKMKMSENDVRATYFDGTDHWMDADECVRLGLATGKFTAIAGSISTTKDDALKEGPEAMLRRYPTLMTTKESINQNPKQEMKLVFAKLKIAENATEQQVIEAIDALEQRAVTAETKLGGLQQAENARLEAEDATLIDQAINEQRIDGKTRETWLANMKAKRTDTRALLTSIPKRVTAQEIVEKGDQKEKNDLSKKTWDELDKENQLPALKASNFELFKAKFKEKFKTDYSG